ncbi:MAG: hypothetical protein IPH30_03480 [Betaproteobacteria bacterium]|nr:hypothetical protein [Betaproteobacteria bacterium]
MQGTISTEERQDLLGVTGKQVWVSCFKPWGVVHHLQDMAQPQHVRNDMHLDIPCVGPPLSDILNKLAGRPSHFEIWTNSPDVRGGIVAANAAPSIAGYDMDAPAFESSFRSAKPFWTTRSSGRTTAKEWRISRIAGFVSAEAISRR